MLETEPLIYNKDIKAIEKAANTRALKPDELILFRLGQNCNETKIQGMFVNMIKSLREELKFLWGLSKSDILIAQRDNGAASKSQRFKKAREGNYSGMPDLDVMCFNEANGQEKNIMIEAKGIYAPARVMGDEKHYKRQIACHDRLRTMKKDVYLTNNPLYVKKVICEDIRKFFNQ